MIKLHSLKNKKEGSAIKLPTYKNFHIQGACSDGNFIYIAYAPTNASAKKGKKKGMIGRFKLEFKDSHIAKLSKPYLLQGIDMGHANGMCYDSKYKRLVITYSNGANVDKKSGDFRFVKAVSIKEFQKTKQSVRKVQKIKLKGIKGNSNASKSFTSIIYNPEADKFILHSRFGRSLMIKVKNSKDGSFSVTRQGLAKRWPAKIRKGDAKGQAAYFDKDKGLFVQLVYGHGNKGNVIYKYRVSDFSFAGAQTLDINSEQEAIFKHKGHVCIVSGGGIIREIKI